LPQSSSNLSTLHTAFVDRLITRWELVIEHHIRLKQAASPEDVAELSKQLYDRCDSVDQELLGLRAQVHAQGGSLPLDQIVETYGLSADESAILQLALMPLFDVSFRTRIARFNNNILFDFVDADLALSLLYATRPERLSARAMLTTEAALFAHRLLVPVAAKDPKGHGLIAHELRPPERLADFLLGRRTLDASLETFATLRDPQWSLDKVILPQGAVEGLVALVADLEGPGPFPLRPGLVLQVVGPSGTGKSATAEGLAGRLNRPVLVVDCAAFHAAPGDGARWAENLVAEARVQGAVLVYDRAEGLFGRECARRATMIRELSRFGGLTVLTVSNPDELDPALERHVSWQLILDMPDVEERQRLWELFVPSGLHLLEDVDLEDLAGRFEITGGQIQRAWEVALRRANAKAAPDESPSLSLEDLRVAAMDQIRASMEDYSVRSKVSLTLDDLILPEKEMNQISEVLEACRNRVFVMSKWGFGKRLVTGKGLCVLFKGEPGTGKTLCAEILASELGMKLYQISIPKVVSKYIGETEKNISKIFSSARANHSMLLFDEADSLFAKRVSVENSVDRFSNMEVNLLLQEIERFEGVCILTTNLDKNMDDAFARRIQFKIDFPFPEPQYRGLIWKGLIPAECPIEPGLDFDQLGVNYELSGGHIKNAVVRAAYRAAGRGGHVTAQDIEFAAEQECKNAGKLFRTAAQSETW
jgi:SpoVK/Ycf46/Vps4 family AAA+-type ATPase